MTIRTNFLNFGKSVVKSWGRGDGDIRTFGRSYPLFRPDNFLLHKLFYKGNFKWGNWRRVLYFEDLLNPRSGRSYKCKILELRRVNFSRCFGATKFPSVKWFRVEKEVHVKARGADGTEYRVVIYGANLWKLLYRERSDTESIRILLSGNFLLFAKDEDKSRYP